MLKDFRLFFSIWSSAEVHSEFMRSKTGKKVLKVFDSSLSNVRLLATICVKLQPNKVETGKRRSFKLKQFERDFIPTLTSWPPKAAIRKQFAQKSLPNELEKA